MATPFQPDMERSPTKIEKAMIWLGQMPRTELDIVKALANSRLEDLAAKDTECKFLKFVR
ncbi:hypothetical protein Slin15195_G037400 [Septoria linicola]|uniref:Uncharacterized protein n=1 Tax=Septoria linicola TaxID=215465 RepID=A0A9Q9AQW8_9PEZI|nr:hypothetical protein Slin14017_G118810 [Septoria linicola]USW50421.1 hypothetical protein Slin15195_G037400 [Septoria linicola]